MSLAPGQTLTHYRLVEKIGEGGMGVVWKAEDTVLNRTVAIKVLPANSAQDAERRRLFLDEARLASSINDAHIAQIYELARDADRDYIVMEFVDGAPLSKLLRGGPLSPDRVTTLGEQVARALSRAHRKGLLHRDIKPGNIMVTPDGDVKLVDFGLATLFDPGAAPLDMEGPTLIGGPADSAVPSRGMTLEGTPAYMSPEQVKGIPVDARSDIFSLGVVLYQMVTGQLPFRGDTPLELLDRVRQARPVPAHDLAPNVPLDLDRIIQKAMAGNPAERYQTMADLAVDLKRLLHEIDSGVVPTYGELMRPTAKPVGSGVSLRRAGLALLCMMSGAAMFLVWWVPRSTARARTLLILPIEVRGQAKDAEYAGRAFAEALAVNLAQMKELNVLPVPAAGLPSGSDALAPVRAAQDVGAGRVLAGSLVRDGGELQVSLSLVDSVKNRIVWGVQKKAEDDSLAHLATILSGELATYLGAVPPRSYDYFKYSTGSPALAGSPLLSEALGAIRRYDYSVALSATKQLLDAFPREPEAHVLRSYALVLDAQDFGPSSPQRRRFEDSLESLRFVDPNNPWGQVFRANLLMRDGRREESRGLFTEVLARNDLTPAARAYVLSGRALAECEPLPTPASLADLEEALRLDPANEVILRSFTVILLKLGRFQEGLTRARQAMALNPYSPPNNSMLGEALYDMKRWAESAEAFAKVCAADAAQSSCGYYAVTLMMGGHALEARKVAELAARQPESDLGTYNLACYKALAGERVDALRLLRRSIELGPADPNFIANDDALASLRGEPDFNAILAEAARRIEAK